MPQPARRSIAIVATLAVAALSIVAWSTRPPRPRPAAKLDFTLQDLSGKDVTLADFKGRPLLINFWETFCIPCRIEMPDLVALHNRYKDDGLVVIGISMHDTPADVEAYVTKYGVSYPVLIGGERDDLANAYALMGFPTSFFIRKDGTIGGIQLGIVNAEELDRRVRALF